jgi:hypothetical protein
MINAQNSFGLGLLSIHSGTSVHLSFDFGVGSLFLIPCNI